MSGTSRFTAAEKREIVHEYHLLPYGQKGGFFARRGVTEYQLRSWSSAVFGGDLERDLIPREENRMGNPPGQRSALERQRAAERAAHEAELRKLNARVAELEQVNDALGKAIGLLHARNAHEPDTSPGSPDRSSS